MELYNNISEEMIASFLEGTADPIDSIQVMDAIANDESIANLVSESNTIEDIDIISLRDGDYGYYELGIDPVFTEEEYREFISAGTDIGINNDKLSIPLNDDIYGNSSCDLLSTFSDKLNAMFNIDTMFSESGMIEDISLEKNVALDVMNDYNADSPMLSIDEGDIPIDDESFDDNYTQFDDLDQDIGDLDLDL